MIAEERSKLFVTHTIRTYPCGIGTSSFLSVRSCSTCISHRETLHIYFFNKCILILPNIILTVITYVVYIMMIYYLL